MAMDALMARIYTTGKDIIRAYSGFSESEEKEQDVQMAW